MPRLLFGSRTAWPVQGWNLRANHRIVRSFVDIDLGPVGVVFRYVVICKDSFHRTFRYAGIAIDTGVGVNVEAVRQLVKCFDRADGRTVGIFAVNT